MGDFHVRGGGRWRSGPWNALTGPPELPCFVRVGPVYKTLISDLARMETPVLYFYSARPAKLSVDVQFPLGKITEWYPDASSASNAGGGGHLHYDSVELMPAPDPAFPTAKGESRYFAARNTDATPLKIGNQVEKMIFYRGVGGFAIPLRPAFTQDGKIALRNVSQDRIPIVILFENRGGKVGYLVALRPISWKEQSAFDSPEQPERATAAVKDAIVKALIARGGLYPKEAQAMLDTWQDSWFEEGMRVIYILPQRLVDAVLPLTIQPAPAETTRAFVGRIEMVSPAIKQDIRAAVAADNGAGLPTSGEGTGGSWGKSSRSRPCAVPFSSAAYGQAALETDLMTRLNSNSCVR